jgi:hypothetical protein
MEKKETGKHNCVYIQVFRRLDHCMSATIPIQVTCRICMHTVKREKKLMNLFYEVLHGKIFLGHSMPKSNYTKCVTRPGTSRVPSAANSPVTTRLYVFHKLTHSQVSILKF